MSEQYDDREWVCVTNGKRKKIYYNRCKKCEITGTTTCDNLNEMFKVVSNDENNIILKCILEKIEPYIYNGGKFIILPESNKYEIEIFKIHKKYILLKQSHLHSDMTLRKGFKINAFRYVRITW